VNTMMNLWVLVSQCELVHDSSFDSFHVQGGESLRSMIRKNFDQLSKCQCFKEDLVVCR
jgi:hypothetical protein